MFKRLGFAALLFGFFASPAVAQGPAVGGQPVDHVPIVGGGGQTCGVDWGGGAGVELGCDGKQILIPATQLIADSPATTTITLDIMIDVEVDTVMGNLWPGFDKGKVTDYTLAAVGNGEDPGAGNRRAADMENAIQNLEALADEAADEARKLEFDANKACAGVPVSLRHILCPKLL